MSQSDREYQILEEQDHGECSHYQLTRISINKYFCNRCRTEFQVLPYLPVFPIVSYDGFKDTIVIKYDPNSYIVVNDILTKQCRLIRKTWV